MSLTPFDRVLKVIARDYANTLLRLIFPDVSARLIGTEDNVTLALPEERVDFVHHIVTDTPDGTEEALLHLEFQTKHESDVPKRMFVYSALLTKRFDLPIWSVILYLRRREAPIPHVYGTRAGAVTVTRFEYPIVKLWEYTEEILAGKWRALVPFLPVLVSQPNEELLQRERELLLQEPDRQKRADLLACAVTIGARHFSSDFLWHFFEEEVKLMEESDFFEKIFERLLERKMDDPHFVERILKRKEGISTGEVVRAELSTKQMMLRHIVYHRFGAIPTELELSLENLLARLTDTQLQALVDAALDAPDIESLQEAVDKFKLLVTEVSPPPATVAS